MEELEQRHKQERQQIVQDDKLSAEIDRKNAEFNAEAARVVENYNSLNSEKTKFETRMAEK
jgi:hypothetical protein